MTFHDSCLRMILRGQCQRAMDLLAMGIVRRRAFAASVIAAAPVGRVPRARADLPVDWVIVRAAQPMESK
jgi:hypothetical protein